VDAHGRGHARGVRARDRLTAVRVAVDVTPLLVEPRGGVARALAHRLDGWLEAGGADAILVGPEPFPSGASLGVDWRALVPAAASERPRAFRRRAAELAALVHADAWLSPFAAFPRLAIPTVVTLHELPFVRLGPVEGRLRAWRHRRALARAVRRGLAIVVPSRATEADVRALESAARVDVVPHGFDPRPWSAAATRVARRGEKDPRRAIAVGATHARKGVDVLLAAIVRTPGVAWILVGRPRGHDARRLATMRDVTVHDGLPDDLLADEIASSAVLVYPSRSEGFGYPPLEAMAAGVPVVASRAGSIPEVVETAAHLVEPGSPAALADGVRRVLDDAALARDLVERGRTRAGAFPPAVSARATIAVLAREAGARP